MTDYTKVKNLIDSADAILIGAGAGLSTSAGIYYGTESFQENFPELVQHYHMTDMYTSSFYQFQTEEERWSYWAKHIDYLYNVGPRKPYQDLYDLVRNKNYFVVTTNVDGQFLKAGFDSQRVFEIQGSLSKIQCAVGCHSKLYDSLSIVGKMMTYHKEIKVPTALIPHCPVCGKEMEVNLRKDAFFVEDDNWSHANESYNRFMEQNKNKKLLLIELGTGFNTPGIIRFPFENYTCIFPHTILIRVNDKYAEVPFEIKEKCITFMEDCGTVIDKIKQTV